MSLLWVMKGLYFCFETAAACGPCCLTAHITDKAYATLGEAISALQTMAVLKVFQAQLLKALDEGEADPEAFKDLCVVTDFALKATGKKTAQAIGWSMGYMVVLHQHLWLTLSELKDADRKELLNAPLSPSLETPWKL